MLIVKLYLILFICITVTDRLHFWDNLGAEIHGLLLGKRKPVTLPYILRCSLCQSFWLSIVYVCIFHGFTIVNLAACLFVSSQNQIVVQLLNFIEEKIINIFK